LIVDAVCLEDINPTVDWAMETQGFVLEESFGWLDEEEQMTPQDVLEQPLEEIEKGLVAHLSLC
jgi:hypothetical protein